jgi:polyisoprenoid-binding protein YceI
MADQKELTRTVNGAAAPHPGTYTLDKAHTSVSFVVRHMMVSKVRGLFSEFEGEIVVGEVPADSKVTTTIQVASITTNDEQRDAHLKSGDFFELETYPTITFVSTNVAQDGSDWKVTGDLTIKGVTKPVVLDVEFNGAQADPWGGTRIGFSAEAEIERDTFGITFGLVEGGGMVVANKVKIELEAEAVLQA